MSRNTVLLKHTNITAMRNKKSEKDDRIIPVQCFSVKFSPKTYDIQPHKSTQNIFYIFPFTY